MKLVIQIVFTLILFQSSAQQLSDQPFTLTAIIIDSITNEPLPFVSTYRTSDRNGTLSNFEGRIVLENIQNNDTLVLTSIGYEKKIIRVADITISDTIYLLREAQLIDQVIVLADDAILYSLVAGCKKTRSRGLSTAKTYLELQSFVDEKQLELFRAYYNGVFRGYDVAEMNMKTGRMILSPIEKHLFASSFDIGEAIYLHKIFDENSYFPASPFTMSKKDLRTNYALNISGKYKDESNKPIYVIGFTSRENTESLFNGTVWIDSISNSILKINLKITNASIHPFVPIYGDMHELSDICLELSKTYTLIKGDYTVNSIDFKYSMNYTQELDPTYKVRGQAVLYAYNYDDKFTLPQFNFPDDYYSDYVKLSVFEDNPPFWNCLTEFKASPNEEMNERFLNNPNNINSQEIYSKGFYNKPNEYVLKRVYVPWSKTSRIRMREMSSDSTNFENSGTQKTEGHFNTMSAGINNYKLDVQLYMDINEVCDSVQIITRAIFDPYQSYYPFPLTNKAGAFINIYFDLMEIQRRKLDQTLRKCGNDKELMQKKYREIVTESEKYCWKYLKEVQRGEQTEAFEKWNAHVYRELGIDNFALFGIYEEIYDKDSIEH